MGTLLLTPRGVMVRTLRKVRKVQNGGKRKEPAKEPENSEEPAKRRKLTDARRHAIACEKLEGALSASYDDVSDYRLKASLKAACQHVANTDNLDDVPRFALTPGAKDHLKKLLSKIDYYLCTFQTGVMLSTGRRSMPPLNGPQVQNVVKALQSIPYNELPIVIEALTALRETEEVTTKRAVQGKDGKVEFRDEVREMYVLARAASNRKLSRKNTKSLIAKGYYKLWADVAILMQDGFECEGMDMNDINAKMAELVGTQLPARSLRKPKQ